MTTTEANDVGLARSHRAMWVNTIRESLERSVPIASDDSFDDLLAQLDAIPAGRTDHTVIADERVPATLARRDAELEAHLSAQVGRLAKAFGQYWAQLAVPDPSACR
jgi:hypothetical protein